MAFDLEMQRRGYIATRVWPIVETGSQAGTFGKVTIESLLANASVDRANGSGYNRGTWKFDDAAYATKERGAEEVIDDRTLKMYRNYFDAEQVCTRRAYERVLSAQEKRVAAAVFNPTTYTGASLTTAVTNEWDDWTNATPIADVEAAVQAIWANSGLWANALIINRKVFRNLRNCAQVIDRIASSGAGSPTKATDVTEQMLAAVFDLPNIIVAGTGQNTANEGQAATIAPIWSNEYAMVCRVAETNDFEEPCIGRTFHWAEDGSDPEGTVETYRDETVRSDVVRVRHDVDEQILHVVAGHLLSNITTAA